MGAVNLGTWRIVIVVALVVVGVAVLANGFGDPGAALAGGSPSPTVDDGDGGGGATETPDGSPSPTEPPEEMPDPNTSGVLVKVFNGTSAPGLAGEVQAQLVDEGGNVAPEEPADAPAKPAARTIVYFRGGPQAAQNESDATYIAETFIEPVLGKMPRIDELSAVYREEVGETITVVVLIGEDYATAIAAEG
jgi:hypothetical protein